MIFLYFRAFIARPSKSSLKFGQYLLVFQQSTDGSQQQTNDDDNDGDSDGDVFVFFSAHL